MADADPSRPEYPSGWDSDVALPDGETIHVRPIRADDGDGLLALFGRLSEESIYLRFFSPVPAPNARQLEHLTHIDYDRRFAIVGEIGDDIVAVARYDRGDNDTLTEEHGDGAAEVAFLVQDDQQSRGIGTAMLTQLVAIGRTHDIRRFVAFTLPQNHTMLRVFEKAGYPGDKHFTRGNIEVAFDLDSAPSLDGPDEPDGSS